MEYGLLFNRTGKAVSKIYFPVAVYFSWRVLILLFQTFIQPQYIKSPGSATLYQRLFYSWVAYWDSGQYTGIALKGYEFPQQAFFPLWPLLIKAVTLIGLSVEVSLYVLTLIFSLATFILFYLLAVKILSKKEAKYALLLFCAYPSSMFLIAGYTESAFLTFTLLAFLLLEKGNYVAASLVGGLSSFTRLVGMAIALSFLTVSTSIVKRVSYFSLCLWGFGAYAAFLFLNYKDPLYFMKANQAWCEVSGRCGLTFPLAPLYYYAKFIVEGRIEPNFTSTTDFLASVIFISLLYFEFKKLGLRYFIYSLTVILIPLMSGSTVGMVRYVMAAFPVFYVLPSLLRSKVIIFIICVLLLLLQFRFVTYYTNKMWVA